MRYYGSKTPRTIQSSTHGLIAVESAVQRLTYVTCHAEPEKVCRVPNSPKLPLVQHGQNTSVPIVVQISITAVVIIKAVDAAVRPYRTCLADDTCATGTRGISTNLLCCVR